MCSVIYLTNFLSWDILVVFSFLLLKIISQPINVCLCSQIFAHIHDYFHSINLWKRNAKSMGMLFLRLLISIAKLPSRNIVPINTPIRSI